MSNLFNFGIRFFTISGGNGELYISPTNAVLKEGQQVKVKGIFNQRFMMGTKQVATITEQ